MRSQQKQTTIAVSSWWKKSSTTLHFLFCSRIIRKEKTIATSFSCRLLW